MVKRAAVVAKLGIKAHAHMLRHACGFKLANDGIDTRSLQAYLGHSNIQNRARYTALASGRFKNFLAGLTHVRLAALILCETRNPVCGHKLEAVDVVLTR